MFTLSTKVTLFTVPTIRSMSHEKLISWFAPSTKSVKWKFSICYFNINSCDMHIDL